MKTVQVHLIIGTTLEGRLSLVLEVSRAVLLPNEKAHAHEIWTVKIAHNC